MQGGSDGDGVRHAAESLRALRDELPTAAEHVDGTVRKRIEAVTGAVEQAAKGVGAELRGELLSRAHEIRLIGTEMAAAREDAFAAVSHVLSGYADEIEALLRPTDGGGPPAIAVPPALTPPPGVMTTAEETAAVQQDLPDDDAHQDAIAAVVASCPVDYRLLVGELLSDRSAHAVERHGHHLTSAQMIARLQWLLDPAGIDGWRLNADGSVESWRKHKHGTHQVGAASGHYTSPQAVAKPLVALLRAAGGTRAGLDALLDAEADGETIAKVFLRVTDTGVTAQDVHTQRAPGTDTKDGKKMWQRARRGAMAGMGDAPDVRAYDMVSGGKRPGSLIVFAKRPDGPWRLLTSYFADDPQRVEYLEP
ncbi:hypothetical protein [Jiangella anatolica]|uniref:Uncharacterized protein n=1 Tax=Jiangella anatolica TaxID=2670374 RepID=A0A2W2AYJ6_9ACTN|nr:hypothetical protein [Jiangella anatolica]PZF80275.1 hypothetical protein C1I92_26980 [Jiangella anatolica]